MNSCGISLTGMRMYSFLSTSVCKYKFLISMTEKRALFVDMTLLNISFDVVISAVLVLKSPGTFSRLPPTVTRTLYGSVFCGQKSTTIFA